MYLYTLTTNIKLVPFRNDVYQRSVRCPDIINFVEPLIYNAKFLGGIFVKFFMDGLLVIYIGSFYASCSSKCDSTNLKVSQFGLHVCCLSLH